MVTLRRFLKSKAATRGVPPRDTEVQLDETTMVWQDNGEVVTLVPEDKMQVKEPVLRSTSYPYLQVAREHGVPYGEVLELATLLEKWGWDRVKNKALENRETYPQWMRATIQAFKTEQTRRAALP